MTAPLLASLLLSSLNIFAKVATPQTVTLNNGLVMPKLAFAANVWPAATCRNATHLALDAGFRFVWSSALVHLECQRAQREAISEHPTVRRADLFLAGTVDTQGCATLDDCRSATLAGAHAQFRILGPEPLEMLMLDYPSSAGCAGITGQWQALTALYRAGKVRSVAVSNFAAAQLSCLFSAEGEGGAVVPPVANQMRFYVGHTGVDLGLNARHGIVVQAYSPLGNGALIPAAPAATKLKPPRASQPSTVGALASDPLLAAIGRAHGKSAAQVALRYILQKNVTVATQSTSQAAVRLSGEAV